MRVNLRTVSLLVLLLSPLLFGCQSDVRDGVDPDIAAGATERSTVNEAVAPSGRLELPLGTPRILIDKSERTLALYDSSRLLRRYDMALGTDPIGDKEVEGDRRTPEGDFYLFEKNPESDYHLGLGISYPNREDAERGLRQGHITDEVNQQIIDALAARAMPPQYTPLGGEIYIHGGGATRKGIPFDWTWGCIALDNDDMTELYEAVAVGTPVSIVP